MLRAQLSRSLSATSETQRVSQVFAAECVEKMRVEMVAYLAPGFRINFPHVGGSIRSGCRGHEPLGCESDVVRGGCWREVSRGTVARVKMARAC